MYNNSFFKKALLIISVICLYSCDKDYNEIGGELIGGNNFVFNKNSYVVNAYSQKTGPIQSNNLEINSLGIYNDINFGETTANFNTQVSLSSTINSIGQNVYVESVVLTIPYFTDNLKKKTNADGSSIYVLDSIYGPEKAKMKLSVYESGYFMRDADPMTNFQQQQKYFTDQNALFDSNKISNRLNNSEADSSQNDQFYFNPAEKVIETLDSITGIKTKKYVEPGMQLNLNKEYFKTRILNAINSGKLASNDAFKNYFRGLYFKMEKIGDTPGNLAMLDFTKGQITITYKEDIANAAAGVTPSREKKTIILNMTGNSVSLLNTNFSTSGSTYNMLPSTGNTASGDEKLYLKGGEGSVAVLELFDKKDVKGYDADGKMVAGSNGVADELDELRNPVDGKKLLINEANLVFHMDTDAMANSEHPQRLYLYDFTNSRILVDYVLDQSVNNNFPKKSKVIFDGLINKNATTKKGTNYKIRITNQIRNLINNKDSTNVKLGIVITEDILKVTSYKVKTPTAFISQAPKASVINPLGIVLFGGKATTTADKRLKLEIYYTKPK